MTEPVNPTAPTEPVNPTAPTEPPQGTTPAPEVPSLDEACEGGVRIAQPGEKCDHDVSLADTCAQCDNEGALLSPDIAPGAAVLDDQEAADQAQDQVSRAAARAYMSTYPAELGDVRTFVRQVEESPPVPPEQAPLALSVYELMVDHFEERIPLFSDEDRAEAETLLARLHGQRARLFPPQGPAPIQSFLITSTCRYVASGSIVTLVKGSVVSSLTHDMEAIRAANAQMEPLIGG